MEKGKGRDGRMGEIELKMREDKLKETGNKKKIGNRIFMVNCKCNVQAF